MKLDVYATKDEIAHATELLREAESTPVIALTSAHALNDWIRLQTKSSTQWTTSIGGIWNTKQ